MADLSEIKPLCSKTKLEHMAPHCLNMKKFNELLQFDFDLAHGFTMYQGVQKLHEAGYDAYLTGIVFASMAKQIEYELNDRKPFKLVPVQG